jgi:hypothetical protein
MRRTVEQIALGSDTAILFCRCLVCNGHTCFDVSPHLTDISCSRFVLSNIGSKLCRHATAPCWFRHGRHASCIPQYAENVMILRRRRLRGKKQDCLTLNQLTLHICSVSKTFGEWYQITNRTEDTNKVNLFVSSGLFVFWYHSPNVLDTPHIWSSL